MKIIKLLALACCVSSSTMSYSEDIPQVVSIINIRLQAMIVDPTCVVVDESQNIRVNLGSWSTALLTRAGDRTKSTPFSISLTDCSMSNVAVSFLGPQDQTDMRLLALTNDSTATGVAIEILDRNQQQIPIGTYSTPEVVDPTNSNVRLDFFANYVATNAQVSAGKAYGTAIFKIDYN